MRSIRFASLIILIAAMSAAHAGDKKIISWKTTQLTGKFYGEGAHFGDFNKDGKPDVVSGPFWYEGPAFTKQHTYRNPKEYKPTGYSDNFLTFVYDFNQDGWDDVLIIGWPGYKKDHEHVWYENPKGSSGHWARHLAFKTVDNESPRFGDLTGDGKPELIFHTGGHLGWAGPDWKNPTKEWTFHKISPNLGLTRYVHGIGFGDVNCDGRMDILDAKGWSEQPASLDGDPIWQRHKFQFTPRGGAQMYAYDFDGDGDNDVLTSIYGHGFGLAWFENIKQDGKITFKEHRFMDSKPEDNRYGVKFSQLHAIDLVDMDGDGLKDIITGKRFWAHGPKGDAEPNAPAVLYWFQTVRGVDGLPGGVDFVPHLIHDDSGVGTQIMAGDFSGDGNPDVITGNKKGTYIHIQQRKKASKAEWLAAQPKLIK